MLATLLTFFHSLLPLSAIYLSSPLTLSPVLSSLSPSRRRRAISSLLFSADTSYLSLAMKGIVALPREMFSAEFSAKDDARKNGRDRERARGREAHLPPADFSRAQRGALSITLEADPRLRILLQPSAAARRAFMGSRFSFYMSDTDEDFYI